MLNKRINNNKGFTLIELMIAMSIISLIAMSFFYILGSAIKSNVRNEVDIKALNIAQTTIENIRVQIKSGEISEDDTKTDHQYIDSREYTINSEVIKHKIIDSNNSIYSVRVSVTTDTPFNSRNKTIELNTEVFDK